MARPNLKFEKRQKELAKQQKAEEKRLRKLGLLDENAEDQAEAEKPPTAAEEVSKWLSE